jgi:hypothetical protein
MAELSIDELREVIRDECRGVLQEELNALLIRALTPPAEVEEPVIWAMSVAEGLALVNGSTDPDFVRETIMFEQQRPQGPRSGLIAACQYRIEELESSA